GAAAAVSAFSSGQCRCSDCIRCSSKIPTASPSSSISRHPRCRRRRTLPPLEPPLSADVVAAAAPVLTPNEAVSRARAMVPRLKERAPPADALRRCPDDSVRELNESGLMRLLQPRRVGGSELPWVALIDVGSELARGCGSTAWNWANYAAHHWMLAFWPVACEDEIWGANAEVLIASSMVFPAGKARRVAGGYRLSGRWPFSSGVDPATWNMLGGIVSGEGDSGEYRMFLLPREDYRI